MGKKVSIISNLVIDEVGTDAIELEHLPLSWAKEIKRATAALLGDNRSRLMIYDDSFTGRPYFLYALVYNAEAIVSQMGLDTTLKFARLDSNSVSAVVESPNLVGAIAKAFEVGPESLVLVVDNIEHGIALSQAVINVRIVVATSVSLGQTFSVSSVEASKEVLLAMNSWTMLETNEMPFTKPDAQLAAMSYLETTFDCPSSVSALPQLCAGALWEELSSVARKSARKRSKGESAQSQAVSLSIFIDVVRAMCANVLLSRASTPDAKMGELLKSAAKTQGVELFDMVAQAQSEDSTGEGQRKTKYAVYLGDTEEEEPADDYVLEFRDLEEVKRQLKERIFGQDKAIEKIFKGLAAPALGINDDNKPLRSMLFLGKTGVGKTQTVIQLAKTLATRELHLVRIDMSELHSHHEVARLFGSPPGYEGHEQGGMLTNAVKKHPHSVILLDEVEKAHPRVWDSFLQVLDAGRMTDGTGETVDFSGCIVIMTSNIGAEQVGKPKVGFDIDYTQAEKSASTERAFMRALTEEFKPELINRIDDIVFFDEIEARVALRVAEGKIVEINDKLKEKYRLRLHLSNALKHHILQVGELEKYGARNVVKNTQNVITSALVGPLNDTLKRKRTRLQNVYLTLDGSKKVVKTTKRSFLDSRANGTAEE